jgi:hypothetical protein
MGRTPRCQVFVLIQVIAMIAFGLTAQPSTADVLPESLRSCVRISNDTERLACFDREVARTTTVASAPKEAAALPLTPEQKIGLSNARVQQLELKSSGAPPPPTELHAHIVSASSSADGLQSFVLDNAQVWRQTVIKSDFAVHQGDAVTISTGALGSFWLSADAHHSTRVKRVR